MRSRLYVDSYALQLFVSIRAANSCVAALCQHSRRHFAPFRARTVIRMATCVAALRDNGRFFVIALFVIATARRESDFVAALHEKALSEALAEAATYGAIRKGSVWKQIVGRGVA